MKKILLTCAVVLAVVTFTHSSAYAQSTPTAGPVTVNISLVDAFSIILGGGSQAVNFVYDAAEDYGTDQTVGKAGHFTVISNKPYNIAVAGSGVFDGPGDDILLETVLVGVGATDKSTGVTPNDAEALSTGAGHQIISGADATTSTVYDINYSIPVANTGNLLNRLPGIYTSTVTYTVSQP